MEFWKLYDWGMVLSIIAFIFLIILGALFGNNDTADKILLFFFLLVTSIFLISMMANFIYG